MKLSWKPNGNHVPFVYFFSVKGNVTESTIIATIHCPDVGYCLFGISLVTHISFLVPCTFPIVIVSYWVVPPFTRLLPSLPVPNWDTLRFLLCITGLVHQ